MEHENELIPYFLQDLLLGKNEEELQAAKEWLERYAGFLFLIAEQIANNPAEEARSWNRQEGEEKGSADSD